MLTQKEHNDIANKMILQLPLSVKDWPVNEIKKIPANGLALEGRKQPSSGGGPVGTHSPIPVRSISFITPELPYKSSLRYPLVIKYEPKTKESRTLYARLMLDNFCMIMATLESASLMQAYIAHAKSSKLFRNNVAKDAKALAVSEIIMKYTEVFNKKSKLVKGIGVFIRDEKVVQNL